MAQPSVSFRIQTSQNHILPFAHTSKSPFSAPWKQWFRFYQLLKSHIGGLSFTLVDGAQSNLQSGKFTKEKKWREAKVQDRR